MIVDGISLKEVNGYPGYWVSRCGRVWSCQKKTGNNKNGKWLNPHDSGYGYKRVTLYVDGIKKTMQRVHRLVAEAYIPNPNGYNVINHIDEDKSNNMVENLEWCTQKHNVNHSKNKLGKFFAFLDSDGAVVSGFNLRDFCKENGLNLDSMNRVIKGKQINHKGFTCPKLNLKGA